MTRATRLVIAGLIVLAGMVGYGLARTIARTTETVAMVSADTPKGGGFPWGAVALVVSLLLLRVAFKTGQYQRGWMHARGIRKSHWAAIRGVKH